VPGREAALRGARGGTVGLRSRRGVLRPADRLQGPAKIRRLNRELFRSRSEILRRYDVSEQQLARWRRRVDAFPAPLLVVEEDGGHGWYFPFFCVIAWETPRSRCRGLFLDRARQ
jgi:hypothetical protein